MRRFRRLLALLLVGILCVLLTGCQALDKMRAAQGFWQEDGSIVWNGSVYRALSQSDDLNLQPDEDVWVQVTAPGVPVLLSEYLGDNFDSYHNGVFIANWYESEVYCRVDKYEEMSARIAEGYSLDTMFYEYEDLDEDEDYVERTYTLTAEQMQAVIDVYTTVIPSNPVDGMYFSSDDFVYLYGSSKDGLFKRDLFSLEIAGSTYYLVEDETLYRVPEQYVSVMSEIFAPYIAAQERIEAYWEKGSFGNVSL